MEEVRRVERMGNARVYSFKPETGKGGEMTGVRSFEDLWIWQQTRELVSEIYSDFGVGAPGCRDYGFRDQLQKAGISIMNNVAEGFERDTNADFARFLGIAKGSCGEVRSMYYPAEDLGYVTPEVATQRRDRARQISAGIRSLREHLKKGPDRRA